MKIRLYKQTQENGILDKVTACEYNASLKYIVYDKESINQEQLYNPALQGKR